MVDEIKEFMERQPTQEELLLAWGFIHGLRINAQGVHSKRKYALLLLDDKNISVIRFGRAQDLDVGEDDDYDEGTGKMEPLKREPIPPTTFPSLKNKKKGDYVPSYVG